MSFEYTKAEIELDRLMKLNANLSETNTKLLEGKEILDELSRQVKTYQEAMIPEIKSYLKALIEVRMSFAREVADIMKSARELGTVSRTAKEILELASALDKLRAVLTPDMKAGISAMIAKNDTVQQRS